MDRQTLTFVYTNYRGETSVRRVRADDIVFVLRSTEYHPDEQWLMVAYDLDKEAFRDFATRDIQFFGNTMPSGVLSNAYRKLREAALLVYQSLEYRVKGDGFTGSAKKRMEDLQSALSEVTPEDDEVRFMNPISARIEVYSRRTGRMLRKED